MRLQEIVTQHNAAAQETGADKIKAGNLTEVLKNSIVSKVFTEMRHYYKSDTLVQLLVLQDLLKDFGYDSPRLKGYIQQVSIPF